MSIADVIKEKRAEILRIAAKYGVHNIRVFGSVARGEAGPESDLDLLVQLEPGVTLLKQAAMVRELEALLGCNIDVVSERGLRPRIRDRVLKEAVPI